MSHLHSIVCAGFPRGVGFALSLSLAAVLAPGVTAAQTSEVDGLLRHGVALRQQGHDDDALAEFRRAWEIAREPRVEAQVALAEQALGRWVDAAEHLEEALRAARDPWIVRNRGPLTESLGEIQRHVGTLRVMGGVPGAEVYINRARVGALPMENPVRVTAGSAVLEVRAPGYYDVSRPVEVPAGAEASETVELVPVPPPPSHTGMSETSVPGVNPHAPTPHPRGGTQRTLAWVALGGAGAAVVVGVVGAALRESPVSTYNGDGTCPGSRAPRQGAACQSLLDQGARARAAEIGGFIAAGALGVASAVLFLTAPSSRAPRGVAWTGCGPVVPGAPGANGTGVLCAGSF